MPVEALIFDLDGTLVDTAPDLMAATNYALSLVSRPPIAEKKFRHLVGHGALQLIKSGLAETGGAVSDSEVKRLYGEFLHFYSENISRHSNLFPGVIELLQSAAARGLKIGVCTNKVELLSHKLLSELNISDWFGAVVGGDTLPVMKPDPAPYKELARRLGVDPQHTLMVGDSETDIRTAQNVGVPVIAVTFGYTAKPVESFSPTHVISHYDQAWPIILNYL